MTWFRSPGRSPVRPARRRCAFRPTLECLEDRCLFSTGGMSNVGELILSDPAARSLYSAVYDPTTGYALFATAGQVNPVRIVEVNLNGPLPVQVGETQAMTGAVNAVSAMLDTSNPDPTQHYAYFGTTSGQVLKVQLGVGGSAPVYLGSLSLSTVPGLSGSIMGGVIDTANPDPSQHFAYVGINTAGGTKIVQLALGAGTALPTVVASISLNANETSVRRAIIDTSNPSSHYAYFASSAGSASPFVVKVHLGAGAQFYRVGAAALNADEQSIGSAVIDAAHGYAYFGTYVPGTSAPPAKVIKVALGVGDAAPTRIGALTLGPGERELSTAVIDPANGYAYFGSDHTYPAKVYEVQLGAGNALPTETGVLPLSAGTLGTAAYPPDGSNITSADATQYGEIYLQSSVIDLAHGYAYFGTDTVPGQVVKVQLPGSFGTPQPQPPGQFQFSVAASSAVENAGTATITVTRTGGSGGAVSVSYSTSDGTAQSGVRYQATAGTLQWADGDSAAKSFSIPLINDVIYEGSQTVNLTLSNPTGGASLGTPASATLTILDDDPPPSSSKMTFQSNRDGNNEIYVMNADGSGQTRLTNNPANDITPAFTRDGRKIAFVSNRTGNNQIYLMNPDGSGLTRLTDDAASDTSPSFSGNGGKIVFVSNRDGNNEIYLMNADGSGQTRLTSNPANDLMPSLSGDGSRIVFASDRDTGGSGRFQIYVMNADGTGLTRLTNDSASDFYPAFSPDGTKITFESNRTGNNDIFLMNADGSNPTDLTNDPASDMMSSFSPDGSKIVYVSNRDGNNEIYVMNTDGSGKVRLTNNPANDCFPSWDDLPPLETGEEAAVPSAVFSAGQLAESPALAPSGFFASEGALGTRRAPFAAEPGRGDMSSRRDLRGQFVMSVDELATPPAEKPSSSSADDPSATMPATGTGIMEPSGPQTRSERPSFESGRSRRGLRGSATDHLSWEATDLFFTWAETLS